MMKRRNIEIEVRFININVDDIKRHLIKLKAKNLQENLLKETIFYNKNLSWRKEGKFIRLRKINERIYLSYKHHKKSSIYGAEEVEIEVNDYEKTKTLLIKAGFTAFREQEKLRHSFILNDVIIDIDKWPSLPAYIEIESDSVVKIKKIVKKLNLEWKDAIFEDAKIIIEKYYGIPVSRLKVFTFKKIA
ncbi:MAG: Adenylate cyclase [Candidatus Levybacteria bacterium GW2011_GWB1_35_5]|nr:MAG: Adenylate cyclase [Candidatus Levybacteria bacterium GW2011_GWB1_35_5]